ncbi:MAG: transposase [Woeseiaceae bacterium]|nr:transposase [Gammaproteobacteria bacterium]NNF49953.1 transposase [Woeseiaceae bacterium]NNK25044.1 transposase [Woeseiaceae bacterium]NNL63564.1 transposase [Woeseiaceae bacterium]
MPRPQRLFVPDIPQHVITRGVDRQPVFYGPADYRLYRELLYEASQEHDCRIHAYVLMTNHVHLLVTPGHARSLALTIQAHGRKYVRRLNLRHGRTGTLWEGRYRACLVQNDLYFLTCQRYVELNPVRAGMVSTPGEYPYSSFAHNAYGSADKLVEPHPCYTSLHSDAAARPRAYRELFRDYLTDEQLKIIRTRTNACSYIGNDRFLAKIESTLGRRVAGGKPGRPKKCESGGHHGSAQILKRSDPI